MANRVPLSVLDLCPRLAGHSIREALESSLDLAQCLDENGYHRYWVAEHHGSQAFLASATSVLLMAAGTRTQRIRLGSGGVMLPNHAPLVIAEHYGTLAEIFPGRIDLGLGRAPGTDPITAAALRRTSSNLRDYSETIVEIIQYLDDPVDSKYSVSGAEAEAIGVEYTSHNPVKKVRAIPGEGTNVPVWLLGSSEGSARVAAALGLPLSFASHFALAGAKEAIELYKREFNYDSPIRQIEKPYVSGATSVVVAPSDEEAQYLASSALGLTLEIRKGCASPLPEPREDFQAQLSEDEKQFLERQAGLAVFGEPGMVAQKLQDVVDEYGFDELVLITNVHSPALRRRSFELLAQQWGIA